MKIRNITLITTIVPVLVIILFAYIGVLHVGNARCDSLYIDQISVTTNAVKIDGGTTCSGEAYKNFKYYVKGHDMYIEIRYVLPSGLHRIGDFNIKVKGEFSQVEHVYLKDGTNKKLIWSHNSPS